MILDAPPTSPPRRIVSLVPSLTEALIVLGLGDRLVGITDWCVHPAREVQKIPKIGGTKDPNLEAVLALKPDLVIANHEENTERAVNHLSEAGVPVWVSYPRTVREGAELLSELAALGASAERIREVVNPVLTAVERAEAARPTDTVRTFCPIWKGPWMSVGEDTYAHDLLELCGAANVFANRPERRYPRVKEAEILLTQPELILLPDEPYAFSEVDVRELQGWSVPAAKNGRIHVIDGTWVSWYGPRIFRAIETLRNLIVAGG